MCNGTCPPNMGCMNFHNHCFCVGCIDTDPGPTGGTGWTSLSTMTWEPTACANSYNVYRKAGLGLADSDGDGVADDYGTCFRGSLIETGVDDGTRPPAGQMYIYAVSGKNLNGEGSIGYASNSMIRPNPTPCP